MSVAGAAAPRRRLNITAPWLMVLASLLFALMGVCVKFASLSYSAGEIVLFDRSWYNRAGVERVMGFCSDEQYQEFFRSVPEFESMLVRSGIQLIKYWFSITDEEQEFRFKMRIHDPLKQWKLSPMDLESRRRWEEYTRAKEVMLDRTHIDEAPWWVVQAVDKKRARLNMIAHLLSQVSYEEVPKPAIALPPRPALPPATLRAAPPAPRSPATPPHSTHPAATATPAPPGPLLTVPQAPALPPPPNSLT